MKLLTFLFIFISGVFLQAQYLSLSNLFVCTPDTKILLSPDGPTDDFERLYIAINNYCYDIASDLIDSGANARNIIDGKTMLDAHLDRVTLAAGIAIGMNIDMPSELKQKIIQLRLELISAGAESFIFEDQNWLPAIETWLHSQ